MALVKSISASRSGQQRRLAYGVSWTHIAVFSPDDSPWAVQRTFVTWLDVPRFRPTMR